MIRFFMIAAAGLAGARKSWRLTTSERMSQPAEPSIPKEAREVNLLALEEALTQLAASKDGSW